MAVDPQHPCCRRLRLIQTHRPPAAAAVVVAATAAAAGRPCCCCLPPAGLHLVHPGPSCRLGSWCGSQATCSSSGRRGTGELCNNTNMASKQDDQWQERVSNTAKAFTKGDEGAGGLLVYEAQDHDHVGLPGLTSAPHTLTPRPPHSTCKQPQQSTATTTLTW